MLMSWNYRVMTQDGGATYGIHEVYYNSKGEHHSWSSEPITPQGDDQTDLKSDLEHMLLAYEKPILEEIDGKLVEKA